MATGATGSASVAEAHVLKSAINLRMHFTLRQRRIFAITITQQKI